MSIAPAAPIGLRRYRVVVAELTTHEFADAAESMPVSAIAEHRALTSTGQDSVPTVLEPVVICYAGREWITTSERAGFFLRRVRQLLDNGDAQLVPLLHSGGLDLLFVSAQMPMSVHTARTDHNGLDFRLSPTV